MIQLQTFFSAASSSTSLFTALPATAKDAHDIPL